MTRVALNNISLEPPSPQTLTPDIPLFSQSLPCLQRILLHAGELSPSYIK